MYQKAGIFWSFVFALCEQWLNSPAQLRYFLQNVLSWSVSEVCIRRSEFSNQFPASYLFLAQLATNWRRAHSQTRVTTKLKSIFTNFLPSGTFICSLKEKWKTIFETQIIYKTGLWDAKLDNMDGVIVKLLRRYNKYQEPNNYFKMQAKMLKSNSREILDWAKYEKMRRMMVKLKMQARK